MESFNGGSDTHVSPRDGTTRPDRKIGWIEPTLLLAPFFCDTGMRAFYGVRPFVVFTNSQLTITV